MSTLTYLVRTRKQCLIEESDQRLVDLARTGSVEAFEAIVLRYRQPLLRHCRRMLTPVEAEDAVQEAFLAAHGTIARTSPDLRLGGWLFRIAHNASLGILGRRLSTASLDALPVFSESAADAVMRQQRLRDTVRAISALPEAERRALVECVFEGRDHREIANAMGRSDGAVRQLLFRARTRLRECVLALAPWCVRFSSNSGDEGLAGSAFAVKGGVILAVGLSAMGGGAAFVSGAPPIGSHLSGQVGAPARVAGIASVGHATLINPAPPSWAGRPRGRRGVRTMQHDSVPMTGPAPARRASPWSARRGVPIDQTGSAPAAPAVVSGSPTASAGQPAAGGGSPRTAATTAGSHTGVAPPRSHTMTSTRQPRATPGRSGSAPAQTGVAPGRSGVAPGQSGVAPGRSGVAPGQSGVAPGQSRSAPGRSGVAPGRNVSTQT